MHHQESHTWQHLSIYLLSILILLTFAACHRAPTPTPTVIPPQARPENNATAVIRSDEGGVIGLNDGAEIAMPRESVSDTAIVTLRVLDNPPHAPLPRSIIGRAYEFSLEGGSLTGIALCKLPLPANTDPGQYDLGVYRWNGRTWERISGRISGRSILFGVNAPAVFSVQGQWRLADATLTLTLPPGKPGQPTISMVVAGQYRYSTLPSLQHDYIQAKLTLKRDSSGGAGQASGNATLDETVAQTTLWLKPDPQKAQDKIEFSHVFEIAPGDLNVPPGSTSRFYAVLIVADSAAPTRRFSNGIEYTQMLPIQVVGSDVVRPTLTNGETQPLRWHVRLNEQTLLQQPATTPKLSLTDILAQGGLGQYRITLEAKFEGKWVPVSNDVTVELVLPATATPPPTATPLPSPSPITTPRAASGSPTAVVTRPPTPTRRTPPGQRTPTPTKGPTPTPTETSPAAVATPTRPAWANVFWADRYTLAPGECTTLHWNVENITAIYLNGTPTTGSEDHQVCPAGTTVYTLRVTNGKGTQDHNLTITVQSGTQAAITFTTNDYEITKGNCTTLHWHVTDVTAVYLNDEGVAGEDSRQVCPTTTTTYELRVVDNAGATSAKQITVTVSEAAKIIIHFWAEQYTLEPDQCTTLHWSVKEVDAVYLTTDQGEEGVAGEGSREVCPRSGQYYDLRATAGDRTASKEITFRSPEPALGAYEIIAQALVRSATHMDDLNPDVGGNQPGWQLLVDGINPLFTGENGYNQAVATLQVDQYLIDQAPEGPVDWPINPGQSVEFRGICTDGTCNLQGNAFYLKLRSD